MSEDQKGKAPVRFKDYLDEMRESVSVFGWVWRELVGPEGRKILMRMMGLMLLMTLFVNVQPLALAWLINAIGSKGLQGIVLAYVALVLPSIARQETNTFVGTVREWGWNRSMFHIQSRLNELVYEKTLGQHLSEGTLLNYASIESAKARVENTQQMLLFETAWTVANFIFSFSLLWYLSWQINIVMTVLLAGHVLWSLHLNYRAAKDTAPIEREFRAHKRQLIERWEKISRVKTEGKGRAEHKRLMDWFARILHADYVFWSWFIRRSGRRDSVILVATLFMLAYGAYLVYQGVWQVGFLLPLYTWMSSISQSLIDLGHSERRVTQQVPYIQSLRRALSIEPSFRDEEGIELTHREPVAVRFENIGLTYERGGRSHPILRGITFTIQPGEKVALLGASGAGKSSLMKLLMREMDPTEGAVHVNGYRLTEVMRDSWMQHVGYIPQRAQILNGTIRYNLTFGLSEERERTITDEEIWEVMRLLKIDFAHRLHDGLDTKVGVDGMELSGGQGQRLMIGAAAIKKPIFMIIDEATSSLDPSTEKHVQEGLEKVLEGPTGALVVAHRLSTVRNLCDRFIVLRPLHEVAEGESQIEAEASSFEALYERSPTFRQLADDQQLRI